MEENKVGTITDTLNEDVTETKKKGQISHKIEAVIDLDSFDFEKDKKRETFYNDNNNIKIIKNADNKNKYNLGITFTY